MSSLAIPPIPAQAVSDRERFRYGWRYVRRPGANGNEEWDRVPLTLEDLLHPKMEDVIPQNSVHDDDCDYLRNVLRIRLARVPRALVLRDCMIIWDDPDLHDHSPDISVIFDVPHQREARSSFDVIQEGVRPKVIFEVVSPNCRVNDVVTEVSHYHRLRVPFYVIVDREYEEGPARVLGYRYTPTHYEPLPRDDQDRLILDVLGLLIGVKDNRVVLYDLATREEIPDFQATSRLLETEAAARKHAEKNASEERDLKLAAEKRLKEVEDELRRLRGGT